MPRFEPEPPPHAGGTLFDEGKDYRDAVLQDSDIGWVLYTRGYLLAAEAMCDRLLSDRQYTDFGVYPILFLYRHYLEISLKSLADDSLELLRADPQSLHGHKLDEVWATAKRRLDEALGDSEDTAIHREVLENAVSQFDDLDHTGQGARYPWGLEGQRMLNAPERLSVQNLRREMSNVARAVEQLGYILSARIDIQNEFRNESHDP